MSGDALSYHPERYRRAYIQDVSALRTAAQDLAADDAIGVDIEMGQRMTRRPGGVQEWRHILALIQLASSEVSVVVDPLRCSDLSPLAPVLAGDATKVFLGGGQDVALLESAGIPAYNVVDVGEAAYAVFGRREDGMAALSKRILGLNLDKTVRRADWLARPLNPALLSYAYQDAELTLLIYRWFRAKYPEVLAMHKRRELEPRIPTNLPDWLRDALLRGSSDAQIIVAEHNLDRERDAPAMAADVGRALDHFWDAPRRVNRLVRIAGDLGLKDLLSRIVPLADSPSSLLRASAARAVGKLADRESGESILKQLQEDPIEDVRKAADAAMRDLKGQRRAPTPSTTSADETEPEPGAGLGEDTLAALQELLQRLEGDSS
jgi:hypothetical protein